MIHIVVIAFLGVGHIFSEIFNKDNYTSQSKYKFNKETDCFIYKCSGRTAPAVKGYAPVAPRIVRGK